MAHLDTNCRGLHPSELVNLPTNMLGYYAAAEGIPEYINMLEEAQRKLARANLPMLDDQLLAIALTAVLASEHFPRPTDEWEALPRANKMWLAWKAHYRAAHIARKWQQLAAGHTTSHHGGAHAVVSTLFPGDPMTLDRLDSYLDNLVAAASTERTTLTQLIYTNATLPASVAVLMASISALTVSYAILANAPAPPAATSTCKKTTLDPIGYCWTHGFCVKVGHTSATCTNRAEGHKDAATHNNMMGGSMANKPTTT